jgi:hypothetical protein
MTSSLLFHCLRSLFQILESEGLRQYVEPCCIQRELSEATGLSADELDHAAHELIRRTVSSGSGSVSSASQHTRGMTSSVTAPTTVYDTSKPMYYEHLGGYGMHEMKDYNRHSPVRDVTVRRSQSAAVPGSGFSWFGSRGSGKRNGKPRNDNETIYVTSI